LVLELVVGLVVIACGIWFHASKDIYEYLTVFVRSENDGILVAAAGIFLAVGFILTFLTIIAGVGVLKNDDRFLKAFIGLIWIVLLLGLVCGFLCVGFRYDIHRYVKEGMLAQLQNHYTWEDNKIGLAWNRVQVKKRCCGVDGSWDYRDSAWFASENSDMVTVSKYVPSSCCVLNFNQDRDLRRVHPQKLQPKDELRCNQDAEGYKDGSANLNGQGCFAALFGKTEDLRHDQSIFTVMDVITGLGLAAGFLQIFAIVLVYAYVHYMHKEERIGEKPTIGRY